jgi:6-phosphogluconolactonase
MRLLQVNISTGVCLGPAVRPVAVGLFFVLLASCSSGGSSPSHYTVGGTVSGLSGSGLVLRDNGVDDLAVTGNGSFTFASPLLASVPFAVTVATQPSNPSQQCIVTNGAGKWPGSAVTSIAVTCGFTVGGTVTGLNGAGLVLLNNGGGDLPVSANGAFVFGTPLADGATFSVSVSAQPSVAAQNCVVMNAGHSGTVHGAGVTGVNIVCTPTGRFGYVVYTGSKNVAGFAIDGASGVLSTIAGTPFAIDTDSLAVVPGAPFAYTSSMGFRIDAATGALIELGGGGPPNFLPVAVDPKGRFVYVLSPGAVTGPCCPQLPGPGTVAAFSVNPDTGALTDVPGSHFVVGIGPQSFAFDPHGKFVYVANGGTIHLGGSSSVSGFAIDPATGALTPVAGSPFLYGGDIVIEPSGAFAYVAGGIYAIDPTSGALAPVDGAVAAAPDAGPLVFDPSGTFAYAPCNLGTCGYRLDAETGALTPLAGGPLIGLGSPSGLIFEPSGKFLIGLCATDVCEFSLDFSSGALTPVPGGHFSWPGTSGPISVAIAN